MKNQEIINNLRARMKEISLMPESEIDSMPGNALIEYYCTCQGCNQRIISDSDALIIIKKSKTFGEFMKDLRTKAFEHVLEKFNDKEIKGGV